jgi:hypothetical protein
LLLDLIRLQTHLLVNAPINGMRLLYFWLWLLELCYVTNHICCKRCKITSFYNRCSIIHSLGWCNWFRTSLLNWTWAFSFLPCFKAATHRSHSLTSYPSHTNTRRGSIPLIPILILTSTGLLLPTWVTRILYRSLIPSKEGSLGKEMKIETNPS